MYTKMITIYHQTDCPHFKIIQEHLAQLGIEFEAVNLVNEVPSETDLGKLLMAKEWNHREIFNWDSSVYRRLELDDVIHDLNFEEIVEILQSNGRLIASPLIVTDSGSYAPVKERAELDRVFGSQSVAA